MFSGVRTGLEAHDGDHRTVDEGESAIRKVDGVDRLQLKTERRVVRVAGIEADDVVGHDGLDVGERILQLLLHLGRAVGKRGDRSRSNNADTQTRGQTMVHLSPR